MKKVLLAGIVCIFTLMFGFANVNAEGETTTDTNHVVIFLENESSVTVDISSGTYKYRISEVIELGKTTKLEAKICPESKIVVNTAAKEATILKSDCTDGTFTWSSSNTSVATVDNGVLTAKGYGTTTITATSSEADSETITYTITEISNSANTSTNSDSNTSTGTSSDPDVIDGDEPDEDDGKLVPKKLVPKENKLVGKQTASNPSTGIKESVVYLVPALLVLGSGIVLKKRSFN